MTNKKKIEIIVEKTKDGFSAYAKEHPVFTTGSSMEELIQNLKEAFSIYFEHEKFNDSLLTFRLTRRYRDLDTKKACL
jgi:predicted RNase H-like HicB family nuclease